MGKYGRDRMQKTKEESRKAQNWSNLGGYSMSSQVTYQTLGSLKERGGNEYQMQIREGR